MKNRRMYYFDFNLFKGCLFGYALGGLIGYIYGRIDEKRNLEKIIDKTVIKNSQEVLRLSATIMKRYSENMEGETDVQ
jgi:hypothetical protein